MEEEGYLTEVLTKTHMVSNIVLDNLPYLQHKFTSATPFKHLCIDNFLQPELAEALLKEFPKFDEQKAMNEFGHVGGKAVQTDIKTIGQTYRALYEYISSTSFLKMISEMLDIPDLLHDPQMYGGGTHENLHGQELDPHVDFNYNQERNLHRRANLLIYLNKEWLPEWGGAIELHSNPRNPKENEIIEFNCLFNRCVVFETNEISWHGFRRINLPPDKRHLSRKCISIYLYSKDRPEKEIVPEHATFYVQRPLPSHIVEGYTLSKEDLSEINSLLNARDSWISYYQKMEIQKPASKNTIKELVRQVKQQNDEVELRGKILDKKRKQLQEEQMRVLHLQQELAECNAKMKKLVQS